jgi:arylsulfatase A-like enzyme
MSAERQVGTRFTRRRLLGAGSGAAGLAALGPLANLADAADGGEREERPNVVLIVADRLRADAIKAYDDVFDDRHTDTPNIDALADDALRFRYAVPESMPAIPMRRSLLTGMRSYPFRDWRAVPGVPAIPGWSKVYDFQPLLPELTAANGVETIYVSDNPLLTGPRFRSVRRTGPLPSSSDFVSTERSYFRSLRSAPQRQEPTQRVLRAGGELLSELRGDAPFFLTLDAFDPAEAFELPRQFVTGAGPVTYDVDTAEHHVYLDKVEVPTTDGLVDTVRERYAAEVRAVDKALGRFLDQLDDAGLADRTVVIFVGDGGVALGEQGVFGNPAGTWHRRVYQVPLLIRDPRGRWAGDESSWFVSTHDIPPTILSYLGITAPGKMSGEDLTTLFDDDDLPGRPYFTTAIDSHVVVGDRNWLLVGRTDEDRWRVYEAEDEDEPDEIRAETVRSPAVLAELKRYALATAGGTLPDFGDDAAIRPPAPLAQDKQVADDGTLDSDEQEANELR